MPVTQSPPMTLVAWARFDAPFNIGVNLPVAGYGITNINKGSAGSFTVNLAANRPNTSYHVSIMTEGNYVYAVLNGKTVNSIAVLTPNNANAATDPAGSFTVAVFQ